MKDVLFVQGAGRNVHAEWDLEPVESLRRELGPGYYVVPYPLMPNYRFRSSCIMVRMTTLSPLRMSSSTLAPFQALMCGV